MRFLFIGAGGIGCYYGARLQQQGHQVTYLARGEHLQALQTHGLSICHPELSFNQPVEALDNHTLQNRYQCHDFDLILLTLKAGGTASLLAEMSAWLTTAETPMLSLQNGVDNEPLIGKTLGLHRTLGGLAVRIGGHIIAPGKIEATGPAQVVMGSWPNHHSEQTFPVSTLEAFAAAFNEAGIPTQISSDIRYELWRKLIINNGVNPLSALTRLDTHALTSHPTFGKTVYRMMQEVAAVSPVDDVTLSQADIDEMYALICNFDAIKTSMLVDQEKGRPLELDGISGAIISRAAKLNIQVPNTELVHALLQQQQQNLAIDT
ncbi:2-dehydropantoate 2-reductase [Amphritea sp. 1_MG-2023]|uniref:ketopantoate reductase family protein n=1 Tax=Amphritea sp. 1_MG-2023 TaxID=3062670 RepID=UPI0026E48A0D|nr:2-dehydropantoate 2-reductase [Amphritea sp. 1_MG-2023]MDO6562211.1 2-dehydropantoate 2-reductase [Amphritea sp. 1_MG-2023]